MTKCLFLCSQAAKAAAEGAAKTADEADAATHEVKQEKVKKTAHITKTAHSFQSCYSQRAALLARAQDESVEGTGTMVDESATQGTKICVDYEPCKKTVGCSRMCPAGKKHRGACVVDGKMVKPDTMQTDTAPRSRNVKVKAGSKNVGIYGNPGGTILRAVYVLSLLVPVAAKLTSSLHWIVSKGQAIDGHMIYLDGNGAPTGFHPFWRDPGTKWQLLSDGDGLYWIVSKGQAIDDRMLYLDSNGVGFHPFWRDPGTKWQLVSDGDGLYWIVSKGQAVDNYMIYIDGNGVPIGFHPFWRDPVTKWQLVSDEQWPPSPPPPSPSPSPSPPPSPTTSEIIAGHTAGGAPAPSPPASPPATAITAEGSAKVLGSAELVGIIAGVVAAVAGLVAAIYKYRGDQLRHKEHMATIELANKMTDHRKSTQE